ncbi:MAG: helix-hairpin-helix domain-containing protein [Cocleimonas sp.]|nr:helix-hairpin-helix domain-containing protein [Cocleimonas sp.]
MNFSLRTFLFSITVAVSLALIASPSYAKDEADKKPKTSKVKQAKKDKEKKETSKEKGEKKEKSARSSSSKKATDKKGTDSDSGAKKSEKGSSKSSEKAGGKGSDNPKNKDDKESKSSKSDDSSSSSQSAKKKDKSSSKKSTTTSKAKKQYKDITVNLNKADAKTFSHYLMGIGEKRAKAITAYRKKNGSFKDIKELLKIEGIGDKIFDGLKKNVSLSKGETSAPEGAKKAKK